MILASQKVLDGDLFNVHCHLLKYSCFRFRFAPFPLIRHFHVISSCNLSPEPLFDLYTCSRRFIIFGIWFRCPENPLLPSCPILLHLSLSVAHLDEIFQFTHIHRLTGSSPCLAKHLSTASIIWAFFLKSTSLLKYFYIVDASSLTFSTLILISLYSDSHWSWSGSLPPRLKSKSFVNLLNYFLSESFFSS